MLFHPYTVITSYHMSYDKLSDHTYFHFQNLYFFKKSRASIKWFGSRFLLFYNTDYGPQKLLVLAGKKYSFCLENCANFA